jgi:hypothetical protein
VGDAISGVSAHNGRRFGQSFDSVTGCEQEPTVMQPQGQIVRGGGYRSSKAGE